MLKLACHGLTRALFFFWSAPSDHGLRTGTFLNQGTDLQPTNHQSLHLTDFLVSLDMPWSLEYLESFKGNLQEKLSDIRRNCLFMPFPFWLEHSSRPCKTVNLLLERTADLGQGQLTQTDIDLYHITWFAMICAIGYAPQIVADHIEQLSLANRFENDWKSIQRSRFWVSIPTSARSWQSEIGKRRGFGWFRLVSGPKGLFSWLQSPDRDGVRRKSIQVMFLPEILVQDEDARREALQTADAAASQPHLVVPCWWRSKHIGSFFSFMQHIYQKHVHQYHEIQIACTRWFAWMCLIVFMFVLLCPRRFCAFRMMQPSLLWHWQKAFHFFRLG